MNLSDLLILFFVTKIKIFTEVFPYDRHGHKKKHAFLIMIVVIVSLYVLKGIRELKELKAIKDKLPVLG